MEPRRKLVVAFDFNNLVFASYFGGKLLNSQGVNVNAIKGFFFRVKNIRETFNPDYMVFANDLSRLKTFRRQLYPKYKGNRKKSDPEIALQMNYARQILSLLGFTMLNDERYEADDILGMVAKFDEELDYDTIIISSDRDLYQLVTDHTFIYSPRGREFVDKAFLLDHYGLRPDQWIDLKILQGDPSDNIPGVRGVGPKTALNLMNTYGSIGGIYDHIQELLPGLQNSLWRSQEYLELTRKLVTIVQDYQEIQMDEEKLKRGEAYPSELYRVIMQELEIPSLENIMRFELLPQRGEDLKKGVVAYG